MIKLLKEVFMKIALINHGCAKNLVDAELMLGLLDQKGYTITLDENEADIVIVNTCSFIHDAEKESVQSILQMIDEGKKVIVTGCLPQKHDKDLKEAKEGIYIAKKDEKYGIIDEKEEEKVPFEYTGIIYNEKANLFLVFSKVK